MDNIANGAMDAAVPMYAFTLPVGMTMDQISSEIQSQLLRNPLQIMQTLQELQTAEASAMTEPNEIVSECNDQEEEWILPIMYTGDGRPILIDSLEDQESESLRSNSPEDIESADNNEEEEIEETASDSQAQGYKINVDGLEYELQFIQNTLEHEVNSPLDESDESKFELVSDEESCDVKNDFEMVNCNVDTESNSEPDLTPFNISLDISNYAKIVSAYKCLKCDYLSEEKGKMLEHYKAFHCLNEEQRSQHAEVDSDSEIVGTEAHLYLCSNCSRGFSSIEDCRAHMIQDHNLTEKLSEVNTDSLKKLPQYIIPKSMGHEQSPRNMSLSARTTLLKPIIPTVVPIGSKKEANIALNIEPVNQSQTILDDQSHWLQPKSIRELKAQLIANWTHKCDIISSCPFKFRDLDSLRKHTECHVQPVRHSGKGSKVFKCFECSQEFLNWRSCSIHLWKIHTIDADMLECPICCEYRTPTVVKLSMHLKVHSSIKSYFCEYCGMAFKQAAQLRNHKVLHLDRNEQSVNRWYTEKKCDICLKMFADSKCLKKHIQSIHSKIRPFICNVCGHSCTRKAMLQMHLRQHTGEKPFSCTDCEYRSGDHNTLRRHKLLHQGTRPYKCPYCPYTAIQSHPYKIHILKKHKDKQQDLTCAKCSFTSVNSKMLSEHISDHERGLIGHKGSRAEHSVTKWRTNRGQDSSVEVFPGNIAAARLVYSCLGEGPPTANITQDNAHSQTIKIEIPARESEDDETQHCFLGSRGDIGEEGIDTGGVTIPAEMEP